jgi:hypothetical protein
MHLRQGKMIFGRADLTLPVRHLAVISMYALAPLWTGHVRPVVLIEAGGILKLILVHV